MIWVELQFSKSEIKKAGDYLIKDELTPHPDLPEIEKYLAAYDVLSNWRSSHAYPMQSMIAYIRAKAFKVNKNAVIVQRLKRLPSILAKLTREKGMSLERMEDIAGCRVVVNNIKDVYLVRDKIVTGRTKNILRRERDYIKTPKKSGYRGIHLIYKYNGEKTAYSNHHVELQIRSNIQHSWATAVEVVGTFTGEALKASQGKEEWLKFFELASVAFADLETNNVKKNAITFERDELQKYTHKLKVLDRLRAFAVTTEHLGKDITNKDDYFILILDTVESKISFLRFAHDKLDLATRRYAELEQQHKGDLSKDIVLVSASSVHGLKTAYPNYFADTSDFAKNLESVLPDGEDYIIREIKKPFKR